MTDHNGTIMQKYSELSASRVSLLSCLPLPHPWAMHIELTNKCTFKCKFCPQSIDNYFERIGGQSSMTFDQFRKICEDIIEVGQLKVLRLYMSGEPLLHKDLCKMIALAKKLNVAKRIEVTSNASALTAAKAASIIDSGLDYLRISIYAIDPDKHLALTQSKINPEVMRNNVGRFFEMRQKLGRKTPFLYVKMINPMDPKEVKAFVEAYREICDEVAIEEPMNWDNRSTYDFLENVYGDRINRESLYKYPKEVCPFPFYTLVIHASGDVSVCCVDWEKKTVVGNIFAQSLKEIWNSSELRTFQRMHIERRRQENEACRSCTFLFTRPDNIDKISKFSDGAEEAASSDLMKSGQGDNY